MTVSVWREAADVAERYYDGEAADAFYAELWGGEDIHIGLYEPGDDVRRASRRTVERMCEHARSWLTPSSRVVDLGAGYGGAARHLAGQFGCRVTCVNVSEVQNARNRRLCAEAGLRGVDVVAGRFEALPLGAASVDVAWSEDALLHSGDRRRVFAEVARVLRPGGLFVFTDPMRDEAAPPEELAGILERLELPDLGTLSAYEAYAEDLGLERLAFEDLSPALPQHYERVLALLTDRAEALGRAAGGDAFVARMRRGLERWVAAGRAGWLRWGIASFRRR